MNSSREVFGSDVWYSRVTVTATGSATLKTVPAATTSRTGGTRRLVITGFHIAGHNTNAAATTYVIRNKTTTTAILLGGSMIPVTGSVNRDCTGCWLPAIAAEDIELNVAGAITGALDITLEGRILPADLPSTRNYTGAP